MAIIFGSWELMVNRFCPGPQEPLLPMTMLKSHINREYLVPSVPT